MLTSLASRFSRQLAAASRTFSSNSGEVVLITGASSGIGYETAKVLASAGYKVVATARRKDKLATLVSEIEVFGGTAAAFRLDVTEPDDFDSAFAFAEAQFGGVNHVFLNAGQGGVMKGPGEMSGSKDFDNFENVMKTNVSGVMYGMAHGIKALRKSGGGSIMCTSSNGGGWSRGGSNGAMGDLTLATPYCVTSAALDQLVRMSAYYQTENIRVYGLKVGVSKSEMTEQWLKDFSSKEQFKDMDETAFAGFNFFFQGLPGDVKHIGRIAQAIMDGSTKWPAGANINCDNDATYDAQIQYRIADTDQVIPTPTVEDLRGYDGGPYEPQEERTKAYIANLGKEEAEE